MIETLDLIEPWMYGLLSTDATLLALVGADSISGTLSPGQLSTPYVTFLCQSPQDINGASGDRISTDNLYAVKAVSQTGSWNDVRPIASRIDALLHRPGQVVTLAGGSLSCVRERTIQYPEVDDGLQYRHLGGIYRIRASAGAA